MSHPLKRRSARLAVLAVVLAFNFGTPAAVTQVDKPIGVMGISREVAPVESRLQDAMVSRVQGLLFTSGVIDGHRIVTVRTGVGKVNAAMAATLLIDRFSPSAVIVTGTAGAIDPDLNPSDVVIGTAVGHHDFGSVTANAFVRSATRNPVSGQLDPLFFPADPALLESARRSAAVVKLARGPSPETSRAPEIHEGMIVTGDAFISSPARRMELRKELKASAVEMEGAAVAQVCARFDVPFMVIRSITDHADGDALNSYQRYVDTASRNAADLVIAAILQLKK